jgi:hypothetical protein
MEEIDIRKYRNPGEVIGTIFAPVMTILLAEIHPQNPHFYPHFRQVPATCYKSTQKCPFPPVFVPGNFSCAVKFWHDP